jgi:hypothetical protein
MSQGRHALPAPPRSNRVVLGLAVLIAAVGIATVWLVDETWAVQAGVTVVVVGLVVVLLAVVRATDTATSALWHQLGQQAWQQSMDRRRELAELQSHFESVQVQQAELIRELTLELRALRTESASAAYETAQQLRAATDQRDLMHDLLVPRQPVADPVYPSLHLPLVRAAFSSEVAARPRTEPAASADRGDSAVGNDSQGTEPFPPRQLLDLTASEIARLRPAN